MMLGETLKPSLTGARGMRKIAYVVMMSGIENELYSMSQVWSLYNFE